MKILVVDDDAISRASVAANLEVFGYEVVEATGGLDAWNLLLLPDSPKLVVMDWTMPGMDGLEVCKRIRAEKRLLPPYIIILTARDTQEDVLEALKAGADEFLAKPVNPMELQARVEVGRRMVDLQASLAENVRRLQGALDQVRTLQGIIPICAYCKKIRNDQHYWQQVEQYVAENTSAEFSHGICPECWEKYIRPEMEELKKRDQQQQKP